MEIKHTFLFTLILGLAWTGYLFAYAFGPDPAMNGINGASQTCNTVGCHTSFRLNDSSGSVSVSGLPSAWAVGQTYPLTVTIQRSNQRAFGFQLSAVVDATNQQAGSFASAGIVQVICGSLTSIPASCSSLSAIQFAEHRLPQPGSGMGTFTVNWTAPADTSLGTIRFNVAGNAADGDGTNQGDYIFTNIYRVPVATAPPPDLSTRAFSIVDRGGSSIITDGGGDFNVGFSRIQPAAGNTTPAGVAIFGGRSNNVLFTEAGVPAVPLLGSARIYAEINASVNTSVNTGLAIANPNSQPANITFHFATSSGISADQTISIPANSEIAKYLNESAFGLAAGAQLQGTFTLSSDVPVAVVALRLLRNERGEELLTTLPVTDLSAPTASGTAYLGHFADGSGATSQVILVNPTDSAIGGTIQFFGQGTATAAAGPTSIATNLGTATSFSYNIPRQGSFKLTTTGAAGILGSVRITSSTGSVLPSALVVFSYRKDNITVSEAGVPSMQGSAFRMYAETNAAGSNPGTIQTGIAIANLDGAATTVNLELLTLDGAPAGPPASVNIPGNGQIARFAHELFNMTFPFKGIIRISGGTSAGLAVVGLRLRYNERGDFLMTTTPPSNEGSAPSFAELLFPVFINGSVGSLGYTTQFILFSGSAGQTSSGNLRFFKNDGSALNLNVN